MAQYATRTPKSQKPDSNAYIIHKIHSIDESNRDWTQGYKIIISIDPGIKNFALRIEKRYDNGYIEVLGFDKIDFSSYETGKDNVSALYLEITRYLDTYIDIYRMCHVVVMEKQLPQNYKMVRTSQHVISYFSFVLRDIETLPLLIEFDAKLKTKLLGCPPNLNLKGKKEWTIAKVMVMLEERGDMESLSVIKNAPKRKQDDLSDIVAQIEAMCILFSWKVEVETLTLELDVGTSTADTLNNNDDILHRAQETPMITLVLDPPSTSLNDVLGS
jgi:hypothetical protein